MRERERYAYFCIARRHDFRNQSTYHKTLNTTILIWQLCFSSERLRHKRSQGGGQGTPPPPINQDATNNKNVTKSLVSSFQLPLSSSRTTVQA